MRLIRYVIFCMFLSLSFYVISAPVFIAISLYRPIAWKEIFLWSAVWAIIGCGVGYLMGSFYKAAALCLMTVFLLVTTPLMNALWIGVVCAIVACLNTAKGFAIRQIREYPEKKVGYDKIIGYSSCFEAVAVIATIIIH